MIVVVSPDRAALDWHKFEPMFRKATDTTHGAWEPVDVLRDILNGDQIMWAAWDKKRGTVDAVITTRIQEQYGAGRVLRSRTCDVTFVGGERLAHWLPELIEVLEKYARDKGCTAGTGCFRRGWLRVWPGSQENGIRLFKDLTK